MRSTANGFLHQAVQDFILKVMDSRQSCEVSSNLEIFKLVMYLYSTCIKLRSVKKSLLIVILNGFMFHELLFTTMFLSSNLFEMFTIS